MQSVNLIKPPYTKYKNMYQFYFYKKNILFKNIIFLAFSKNY